MFGTRTRRKATLLRPAGIVFFFRRRSSCQCLLPRCWCFVPQRLRLQPVNPLFPVTCRGARPSPGKTPTTICSNGELEKRRCLPEEPRRRLSRLFPELWNRVSERPPSAFVLLNLNAGVIISRLCGIQTRGARSLRRIVV